MLQGFGDASRPIIRTPVVDLAPNPRLLDIGLCHRTPLSSEGQIVDGI